VAAIHAGTNVPKAKLDVVTDPDMDVYIQQNLLNDLESGEVSEVFSRGLK
jgi:hypothetical protein